MKRLLLLIALMCAPAGAQSFSGQSAGDIFVAPPYRACWGADNGQALCITQTGNLLVRATGAIDAQIPAKTVSTLGSASLNNGRMYRVTDGTSATDCTIGGGSTVLLCLSNGTSWSSVGGAGGGAPPSGNNGDLQSKNGSNLAASHINDNGTVIATSEDTQLIGPNPSVDIRAYGARAVIINTTGTGSGTALTVGSSSFVNGDGITIQGGGAAPTMSTPSAPTVTPGEAEGETASNVYMAAGAQGSTNYSYTQFSEDANGGLTAASSAGTTSTGAATLGKTTVTLSSISLTGNTLSITSSGNHGLLQNALFHITNTTANLSFYLSGWFTMTTINSGTTATAANTPEYAATTQTGAGTGVYFTGNTLSSLGVSGAFRTWICKSGVIVGVTLPGATTWTDFGFAAPPVPWYISNANCSAASAQNRLFTTTVSAGGGTTSLTLTNSLTNSVTTQGVRLDAAPGILAAANAAAAVSAIYIPSGTYTVNSYLQLPANVGIIQAGNLQLNDTLAVGSYNLWSGGLSYKGSVNAPQFAIESAPQVTCTAYPCVSLSSSNGTGPSGADGISHLQFSAVDNDLIFSIPQGGWGYSFDTVIGSTGVDNGDNYGIILHTLPGASQVRWENSLFFCGPNQNIDQTWSPCLYLQGGVGGTATFYGRDLQFNRRGVYVQESAGSPLNLNFEGFTYRQGGITPMFAAVNNSGTIGMEFRIGKVQLDTEQQALLAFWNAGGSVSGDYRIDSTLGPQNDGGGIPALVTGNSVAKEWSAVDAMGFTGQGLYYAQGVLNATSGIVPNVANSFNLGTSANPFANLFLGGSLTFTTVAPIIWQSVEGSCTGAAATKDSLCIGGATSAGYAQPGIREAVGAGSFLRIPQETTALESAAAGTHVVIDANGNLAVSATAAPSSNVFYAAVNCNGLSNCFTIQPESAPGAGTPDNCGTALTNWIAAINAVTGSAGPVVYIKAPGNGQAALFQTCHLAFEPITHTVNTYVTFYCSGTLDAGTNSSANLIQFGDGTHSDGLFFWQGCNFVGGASLTVAGIETLNQTVQAQIAYTNWYNFGAGNATVGSCTNYAVQFDNFIFQGQMLFNSWFSEDTTAGRCGFNNATTNTNEGTVNFSGNIMQGNSSHCASVLIVDGGTAGMMSHNNLGNAGIPIFLKGVAHRITDNELDTEACTANGVNAVIQVAGSSAAPVPDAVIAGNTVQMGAGHAFALAQMVGGSVSSSMQSWTITNNNQSVTTSTNAAQVVGGTLTSCAQRLSAHGGCYMSGNQDMQQSPSTCGTSFVGWQVGDNVGFCAANTAGANVGSTTIYTQYNGTIGDTPRVLAGCKVLITTAATTSSTLPQCEVIWTDNLTSTTQTAIVTPVWASGTVGCNGTTTNTVGNSCAGSIYINPKANTTVTFQTINYASTGATAMVAQVMADAKNALGQ